MYVTKTLMEGETVAYHAKLHKIVFAGPLSIVLFGLAVAAAGAFLTVGNAEPLLGYTVLGVGALVFLGGLVSFIPKFVEYWSSEFAVTNKRVIVKLGFIRSSSFELLLSKVEGMHVEQSIAGRMLGFGTLSITATGGSRNDYVRIARPLEFRTKVQEQIDAHARLQHEEDAR